MTSPRQMCIRDSADHDQCRQYLIPDHAHAILHLKQRDRYDVEVCGHRRKQRTAVAAGERQHAHDRGIGSEGEHERGADAYDQGGDDCGCEDDENCIKPQRKTDNYN